MKKTNLAVLSLFSLMAIMLMLELPIITEAAPPKPGKSNFGVASVDFSSKKVSFEVGLPSNKYMSELQLYKGNKKIKTITFGKTSKKIGISKNAAYKYRVRIYKKSAKKSKSAWSPYRGFMLPDINGNATNSKKGFKLNFKKAAGATKYTISVSQKSSSSGFKKVATIKAKSKKSYSYQVKSKYAAGKTNYIRITPYIKLKGFSGASDILFSGSIDVYK